MLTLTLRDMGMFLVGEMVSMEGCIVFEWGRK